MSADRNTELAALAAAHGVSTRYEDAKQQEVDVDPDIVRTVLGLLDVPANSPADVRDGLALARRRADTLPRTVVVYPGERWPSATAAAIAEDGTAHDLPAGGPIRLPLGWYRLAGAADSTLIVAPSRLPDPPPAWGWMLQLYALHSAGSWGAGDIGDLGAFVEWAAAAGEAGFVLLNPMHAVSTVPSVQASPYSPSSRRFTNPLYLSVPDTGAYRRAPADVRARVDALRPPPGGALIDYDRVWRAKLAALEALFPYAEPAGEIEPALRNFATFCALAEQHGANWQEWPEQLRRPESPAVADAGGAVGERVAFHAWLQRECRAQLSRAQDAARAAGMPVGLVHDLAVGVDPAGADGWLLQDVLARGVHVGAPPDAFNQRGQDWGLAAWRPDRLVATGYAAYRDQLRSVLATAGGIRVDHVLGLWRLWWVLPGGGSPEYGTYVRYDARAMLGVLALEAHLAGAVVVAEDLGTVEPGVRETLRDQHMLSSEVLWFAREVEADGGAFRPPATWPAGAAASISTHDLPTAPGLLAGEHVRVRAELGLLAVDLVEEQARAAADRAQLVALLRSEGLVPAGATDAELVLGMHRLLAASPCRFLMASPYDVLGETRQPNLPGTVDEYPNWRIPLPAPVEAMRDDPRMHEVAALLGKARPRP
ncbi:MAG TPA: 4-alpha-glucanotransferase [Micromonosporaceae bacterium]|nr:4-alpha-glucanotransferase [Micromonosporaceae bacterium]